MAKRVRMLCAIQEHSLSNQEIKLLEAKAQQLYKKYFGERFQIMPLWVVIPRGQAFLAAQPSTASTVTVSVADGTDNEIRHAFMSEFCQMWIDIVKCHKNEIIFNVPDKTLANEFAKAQIVRLNPRTRPFHVGKLLFGMLKSKVTNGYFSISMNFSY